MAWIESHQELARHPKTKRLARLLGVSLPTAIGHLHLFWWWAMDYSQDGDLSKYDSADIEDACEWDGVPGKLYSALRDSKFVDHDDIIHDWYDYAGRLVEKREQNKERKRRSRAKKVEDSDGHANVTRDDIVTDSSVTGLPNTTQPNHTEPNHTEQNITKTEPSDSGAVVVELNPYRMFQSEGFGTISPVIADQLNDLVGTYGERWVCEALKKAVVAGKRKISYVVGILKNWQSEGVDDPWTKEPQKKGLTTRGNQKPVIPIATDSEPPNDVSDEEYHKMLQEAQKMQESKGGRSQHAKALA
ncbi:DnaD domain-containing protein [Paenibacillus sp. SAF-054]|uniref:DnaD domain-containing protein n=1 Tax=unclassified Paenibacillus TaxID=185978 RepID=UPI003F800E97